MDGGVVRVGDRECVLIGWIGGFWDRNAMQGLSNCCAYKRVIQPSPSFRLVLNYLHHFFQPLRLLLQAGARRVTSAWTPP